MRVIEKKLRANLYRHSDNVALRYSSMRKQMMNLEQDHYKDSEHDNEFQTLQADGYDSDPYDDCSPVRLEEDEGENQDLIIQR